MAFKILHTADWHLGKRLDNFSRLEEQKAVLEEICEIADKEKANLILLAGDLFDAFNPSTEAIELFYKTLKKITRNGTRPVIAIAGNHDSPERIDAPDPLARESGIIFVGFPNAWVKPFAIPGAFEILRSDYGFLEIQLEGVDFPIRIIHTAYANEVRLKRALDVEDKNLAMNEVLGGIWQNLADTYCDDQGVNVLISHLYMNCRGAEVLEEPEGEKPLKIGNADMIFSDLIPSQIAYTALGHLHRHHQIGNAVNPVVYSGSPLAYSFAEASHEKYVIIVEATPESVHYKPMKLNAGRPLSRKRFESIDDAERWLLAHPDHLVELTLVSEHFLQVDDLKRLYKAHQGIISIIPQMRHYDKDSNTQERIVEINKDIEELFQDYFSFKHGQKPNQELRELFKEILETDTKSSH